MKNSKIFVRVLCIVLGVLMVAGAISLIALGFTTGCQPA